MHRLVSSLLLSLLFGCSAAPRVGGSTAGGSGGSTTAGTGGSPVTGAGGGSGGGISLGDGGLGDAATGSDCSSEATLIYVVSDDDKSLYSFYPPSLKFTKIGVLACEPGVTPFAMSVARDAVAWVIYDDGALFRVSTTDASCTPTAFVSGQHGFTAFGMGFSANAPGSQAETLFGCWTQGLASIDTTSLVLTPVGTLPGLDISGGCDLTGTGNGDLFTFIPQPSQWVIGQLDKTTSAPMWSHVLTPPIPAGGSWGTSFWGGDLYLYTALAGGSTVWRYSPSDQTTVELVADVGFTIVGAGQSTCVPVTPPM
jgi:hypothetical protein